MKSNFGAPVTALLAAGMVGSYGLELNAGGHVACVNAGFVAGRPELRTALSSLFLHDPSNPWHLAGNVAFLVVFGILVELEIGSLGFAALFVAAGLGGAAMHWLIDPSSTVPLVGCSGAIFGLLAVAAVLRPWLLTPVVVYVGLTVWEALTGTGGHVSVGAHLGGFVVGAIVAGVVSRRDSTVLERA